jgi:protein phosphatase
MQLSVDDTIGGTYSAPREFTAENRHPQIGNVLTRAAGSQEDCEMHLYEFQLEDRDRVLLCSDGLHSCVDDARIHDILAHAATPAAGANALITAAKELGAPDNVSAVVFEYRVTEK